MARLTSEGLFGSGLEALMEHLRELPDPAKLVGRRMPVLAGYGSHGGGDLLPFVCIPGTRRPSLSFECPLAGGKLEQWTWKLLGRASYEQEGREDIYLRSVHTPEEREALRNRWPWAFPDNLLPAKWQRRGTELHRGGYWQVGGVKPISIDWLFGLYQNESIPRQHPALWIKFTFASLNERLLQAHGFVSLSSVRRRPELAVTDEDLRRYASLLRPREQIAFLLKQFKDIRELPENIQVMPQASRSFLKSLASEPAGEPQAELPVIVLGAEPEKQRISIRARMSLLLLQSKGMPEPLTVAAEACLQSFLAPMVARCRKGRQCDDATEDVLGALLQGYSGRDVSSVSFQAYVASIVRRRGRTASPEVQRPGDLNAPLSAMEVAVHTGASVEYIYKLARRRVVGTRTRKRKIYKGASGLMSNTDRTRFTFSPRDIDRVRRELAIPRVKSQLVKLVAENRGTTERAAQRLIRRRLAAGHDLMEVVKELSPRIAQKHEPE